MVGEGGDREGEAGADLMELGLLEFECEQSSLDTGCASLTTLVSIEDTWHSHQVQGHSKLGISFDIQRLISRKPRCEARCCVLSAGKASIGDVEELRGVGRWW